MLFQIYIIKLLEKKTKLKFVMLLTLTVGSIVLFAMWFWESGGRRCAPFGPSVTIWNYLLSWQHFYTLWVCRDGSKFRKTHPLFISPRVPRPSLISLSGWSSPRALLTCGSTTGPSTMLSTVCRSQRRGNLTSLRSTTSRPIRSPLRCSLSPPPPQVSHSPPTDVIIYVYVSPELPQIILGRN